jgi:hypothetical protein
LFSEESALGYFTGNEKVESEKAMKKKAVIHNH